MVWVQTFPTSVGGGPFKPGASDVMVEGLYEVAQALASGAPPRSLQAALDVLSTFLELRAASLMMFGNNGAVEVVFTSSLPRDSPPILVQLTRAAARRVAATHMPLVVESVWAELYDLDDVAISWQDTDLDASLVGVPVKDDAHTIGALTIVREHSAGDQAAFTFDADVRLLGSVANLVGIALRVGRLDDGSGAGHRMPSAPPRPSSPPSGALAPADGIALGGAPCWQRVMRKAQIAAHTNATVLLRGETGTGKSMIARVVHEASHRSDRPFVVVNCAALSESLLETELFGHEKGAFTGALGQRKGRFELADGGTLFLDEIGELSAGFQAKLLRVLQEGEFERVGATATLNVDVRIIAATHRDLEAAVAVGTFRADLYYRLCVVPICVPPLRERLEDIPLLAHAFLEQFNSENDAPRSLNDAALGALARYAFPGNVRELENAIRRAASLSDSSILTAEDFSFLNTTPQGLREERRAMFSSAPPGAPVEEAMAHHALGAPEGDRLIARERLIEVLQQTGWVQARAARRLGMTPRQVGYAVQRLGIQIRKY